MDGIRVSDFLSKDEIQHFTSKNDVLAAFLLLKIWAGIVLLLAIPAIWPNPLTIALSIILLGGRQMALGVLVHDCGHRTFFSNQKLNAFIGRYLAGNFVLIDAESYAKTHLVHHRKAGSKEDPDLPNYQAYPVSKQSFRRKIIRDISGQTGLKFLAYLTKNGDLYGEKNHRKLIPLALSHLGFIALLSALGVGWLYFLWAAAFLTSFQLCLRLRQVAEHAAVEDIYHPDPRRHTRTTYSNVLSRLFLAVNDVNYHMEHHFMPSVPCYRLAAFHQRMKAAGAYEDTPGAIASGYLEVFRQATAAR